MYIVVYIYIYPTCKLNISNINKYKYKYKYIYIYIHLFIYWVYYGEKYAHIKKVTGLNNVCSFSHLYQELLNTALST